MSGASKKDILIEHPRISLPYNTTVFKMTLVFQSSVVHTPLCHRCSSTAEQLSAKDLFKVPTQELSQTRIKPVLSVFTSHPLLPIGHRATRLQIMRYKLF